MAHICTPEGDTAEEHLTRKTGRPHICTSEKDKQRVIITGV